MKYTNPVESLRQCVIEHNWTAARPIVAHVLSHKSGDIEALELTIPVLEALNEREDLRRVLKKLVSTKPDDAWMLTQLALAALRSNDHRHAALYLIKADTLAGNDPFCLLAISKAFAEAQLFYSAAACLRRTQQLDPSLDEVKDQLKTIEAELNGFCPKVTFYIPCYNAQDYLETCVKSVLAQTYPIHEILIIDDGCTDNSVKLISNYPVRVIAHEKNLGLSAGRNTAFRNATGDFIASIDSDVMLEPYWLETLLLEFRNSAVAGANGRMVEANTFAVADRWRSVHMRQNLGDMTDESPKMVFGCNTLFRREAVNAVGGYDPRLVTNNEDYDLFIRIRENGGQFRYQPRALCRHLREDTLSSVMRTHARWFEPYYDRLGQYAYYQSLAQRNQIDVEKATGYVKEDIQDKRSTITYPSFFLAFHNTLSNLAFFAQCNRGMIDSTTLSKIAAELMESFKILMEERGVDSRLLNRILEDLAPLANCLPKLAEVVSEKIRKQIQQELPEFYLDNVSISSRGRSEIAPRWAEEKVREIKSQGIHEVIVYGAGEIGRGFLKAARNSNLRVRCLVDRNTKLWGTKVINVPVCGLKTAMDERLPIYVVASFAFTAEIIETIKAAYVSEPVTPQIFSSKR